MKFITVNPAAVFRGAFVEAGALMVRVTTPRGGTSKRLRKAFKVGDRYFIRYNRLRVAVPEGFIATAGTL